MKRLINPLLMIFGAFVLSACTSIPIEQVDGRISAWKGLHIDELVKYWGLPSNQRQVGDKHYAEWVNQSSEPGNTAVTIGTGRHSRHSAIGVGFTLFDLGGKDDACSRLVTHTEAGLVTDISWQGTQNYCFEITPDLSKVRENKAVVQKKS
ncbi:hypothetical protein [Aliikangiella coralliicola]|uniref:Lipoprotein n=1 Tax=Aliikangiella coralliicola TaxID=2592383 RepID=A0A545U6B8_9GAMM|nr:hypothetical protein [Aliikangiella coralliicola]TQV85020.1 hypothetical protein FLL46_21765 [Aliikangiella coralliicola]